MDVTGTAAASTAAAGEATPPDAFAALLQSLSAPQPAQQPQPVLIGMPADLSDDAGGTAQQADLAGPGAATLPEAGPALFCAAVPVPPPGGLQLKPQAAVAPEPDALGGTAPAAAAPARRGRETQTGADAWPVAVASTDGPELHSPDAKLAGLPPSPQAASTASGAQAAQAAASPAALEIHFTAGDRAPLSDAPAPAAAPMGASQPQGLIATASARADAAPIHQAALPSRPFEQAFAGDLASEVRLMVGSGAQRAELRLNPSDLGPIHIQLSVTSQTADISFAAAHGATRDGITQALPALREMLAGQGLSLGHAGVSSQHAGQPSGEGRQSPGHAWHAPAGTHGGTAASPLAGRVGASIGEGRGMLDLYA